MSAESKQQVNHIQIAVEEKQPKTLFAVALHHGFFTSISGVKEENAAPYRDDKRYTANGLQSSKRSRLFERTERAATVLRSPTLLSLS